MGLEIDSDLKWQVIQGGPDPYVYIPIVDFEKIDDPSIIEGF